MKLRFLMSHHRKNSVRDKVIGKEWIYSDSERSTFHGQSVGHHRGQVRPWSLAGLVLIGCVISYANKWKDYSNYFGEEGGDFQDLSHCLPTTPSSNNTREYSTHVHHQMVNTKIRLIILFATKDGEVLYSRQKQDQELTVAQIMSSLLPNSDWNWRK